MIEATATKFGQFHVAEAPSTIAMCTHLHTVEELKETDHESPLGVLDQEDLIEQGIDTSKIIPGALKVDALGSCTANATTAELARLLGLEKFAKLSGAKSFADVVGAEEFAIRFYHGCTDQTGTPSQEWPPTDCGSSGPYVVEYCKTLGVASGALIASGAQNIISLAQKGALLQGAPFLNAWMEPDANGFVDGNGSASTLESQIRQGVAGGHETVQSAVEKLVLTETGLVVPHKTILRYRNSWTKSWGDNGSYRMHLSTVLALGSNVDLRLLQAA